MKTAKHDRILLAHGGGGQLMEELISQLILPKFKNDVLAELGDSAKLNLASGQLCFTTDSYVVKPLFFNGGDIGKLAVCGTINDLAVAGSKPVAIALALIIEEGFEIKLLEKILDSISEQARLNNVDVVTGDIKTVEAGAVDKIFINTAGLGVRLPGIDLAAGKIKAGDKILINGTIGDHGMTIISQREDINPVRNKTLKDSASCLEGISNGVKFQSSLKSDCAGLADLTCKLLAPVSSVLLPRLASRDAEAGEDRNGGNGVKFMRDPTRGGLAATLNEISRDSALSIEIREADIPINPAVQAAADMLGFDVLNIANEGKFVAVVSPESADDCLNICRKHPLGKDAKIIGEVVPPCFLARRPTLRQETRGQAKARRGVPTVELVTKIGGRRIVQMPYGRELPRIC
jgi:hydrogenase expression/formation protein HypE